MKKLVLFSLLMSLASPLTVLAQEQFLRLDSIVIIERTLSPITLSQSTVAEDHDTVNFTVLPNQIAKVRVCAMSLTNTSTDSYSYMLSSSSARILDSRIEIDQFNMFTSSNLVPTNSAGDFRGSYNDFQIKTTGFAGYSKHDFFINEGTHEAVFHFRSISFLPEVHGRIELIYYSFE